MNKTVSTMAPVVALSFLVLTVLGGYWPVLGKMVGQWNSGDNNYCFLIIPLFAYLCWEKKEQFQFQQFSWSILGVLLAIPAVGLVFLGELGSTVTLVYLGIWTMALSLIVFLYGRRAWFLLFPLFILLFIVPLPPFINRMLTFELKLIASQLSTALFRLMDISVLLEGNVIDLGIDKLEVVNACSGLRYLVSMLLMAIMICCYFSRGWWRRAVILLLVPPLLILFNAIRIFITGLLVLNGHKSLTEGAFHDGAGLVLFLAAGIILTLAAKGLEKIGPPVAVTAPEEDKGDAALFGARAVVLTVVLGLFLLGSGIMLKNLSTEPTHPQRQEFSSFPLEISGWQGQWHYLSEEILQALWADDYVNAAFTKKGSSSAIYLLIPFYSYQATSHAAHAPQSCLLGGGYSMNQSGDRFVPVDEIGPGISVREMILQKGDYRMLATYFFFQRGRVITSPWLNKWYLMWDAITRKRTDGALVRVEMAIGPGQDMEEARAELNAFIAELWRILPEYIPE